MFKDISEVREYIKGALEIHLGGKINCVKDSFFNNKATTGIDTLALHDALTI